MKGGQLQLKIFINKDGDTNAVKDNQNHNVSKDDVKDY